MPNHTPVSSLTLSDKTSELVLEEEGGQVEVRLVNDVSQGSEAEYYGVFLTMEQAEQLQAWLQVVTFQEKRRRNAQKLMGMPAEEVTRIITALRENPIYGVKTSAASPPGLVTTPICQGSTKMEDHNFIGSYCSRCGVTIRDIHMAIAKAAQERHP